MYQFTEDCLTGIEEIDNEHRKLFTLINEAAGLPPELRTAKTVAKIPVLGDLPLIGTVFRSTKTSKSLQIQELKYHSPPNITMITKTSL